MKRLSAGLAAILWLGMLAHAQAPEKPPGPPSVTVSAEAVISVQPNKAEIDIGVVTQAPNAREAAQENARKVSRVIAELRKTIDKSDEVKTAGYSLAPNYHSPRDGKPEITGYTATNTLHVTTGDLARVGPLIDTAMQAGANNINRLVFTLKDEQQAQIEALRMAARKARAKADETAAALGLKVLRVLSVVEGERGFRPIPMQARAHVEAMAATPTPVEAGTLEVRSSVTLSAEVGPR